VRFTASRTSLLMVLAWQPRCAVPPVGPLMPNGPPMACADPSVRVGPGAAFAVTFAARPMADLP
jgi:hypothetical protein